MRSLLCAAGSDRASSQGAAPTRLVWLPGAYQTAEDFLTAGFERAVRRRKLPLDLEFVDLEFSHLGDRAPLEELRRRVLLPARAAGCRSLWLAGISLGGFVALDYADEHPGEWDGLCLLAPYLGNRMLTAEIRRAPGLRAWQPGGLAQADAERRVWRFIQGLVPPSPPGALGRVYLGYGREDRFAESHALMASALPAGAVRSRPGGHDWATWCALWEEFLDAGLPWAP